MSDHLGRTEPSVYLTVQLDGDQWDRILRAARNGEMRDPHVPEWRATKAAIDALAESLNAAARELEGC